MIVITMFLYDSTIPPSLPISDPPRKPLIIGNLFDTATSYSWAQESW